MNMVRTTILDSDAHADDCCLRAFVFVFNAKRLSTKGTDVRNLFCAKIINLRQMSTTVPNKVIYDNIRMFYWYNSQSIMFEVSV